MYKHRFDEHPLPLKTVGEVDDEKEAARAKEKETEEMIKEVNDYLASVQRELQSFAQDSSLKYKAGKGFCIDLSTGTIQIDARWFQEQGYEKGQIYWALLHEICHFRDLVQDKEGFDKARSRYQNAGKQIRPQVTEIIAGRGKKNPEKMAERFLTRAYHRFQNFFDDVYVNSLVRAKAPRFNYGQGSDLVKKLYREKLFPGTDYTSQPQHLQFLYACLRTAMLPDEEIVVSPEVEEALNEQRRYFGENINAFGVVKSIQESTLDKKSAEVRAAQVLEIIEPAFRKFLLKDLENMPESPPPTEPPQSGEGDDDGELDPFAEDYDDYDKRSPDQISEKDMDDMAKKTRDKIKKGEEDRKKTPVERAKEAREVADRAFGDKYDIDERAMKRYRDVEKRVEDYMEELAKVWRGIIDNGWQSQRVEVGFFQSGNLNIPEVIRQWSTIKKDPAKARVMTRSEDERIPVGKPECIRFRFMGDGSTSMEGEKLQALMDTFVLVNGSFGELGRMLDETRWATKTPLVIETQAWMFGSEPKIIKPLETAGTENDNADLIRSMKEVNAGYGGTNDHIALATINADIPVEEDAKRREGKIKEICIFVTDGGSSNPLAVRAEVEDMLDRGILMLGVQIGEVSEGEKASFASIWIDGFPKPFGIVVKDPKDLPKAIAEVLRHQLKDLII